MFWKFVCRSETESECFQRGLFGSIIKFWDDVKEIKKGDVLFLYNIDTDVLFGPFIAATDGGLDIDHEAWGGRFQAQVRVEWKAISILQEASKKFPFLRAPEIRLPKEQGEELLRTLTPQIEVPLQIKSEIQQLDAEIHTIAHRIEETLMHGKGHPADRVIDLEGLKAEFTSKMRDFVKAIRKLDKQTRLFDLPSNR